MIILQILIFIILIFSAIVNFYYYRKLQRSLQKINCKGSNQEELENILKEIKNLNSNLDVFKNQLLKDIEPEFIEISQNIMQNRKKALENIKLLFKDQTENSYSIASKICSNLAKKISFITKDIAKHQKEIQNYKKALEENTLLLASNQEVIRNRLIELDTSILSVHKQFEEPIARKKDIDKKKTAVFIDFENFIMSLWDENLYIENFQKFKHKIINPANEDLSIKEKIIVFTNTSRWKRNKYYDKGKNISLEEANYIKKELQKLGCRIIETDCNIDVPLSLLAISMVNKAYMDELILVANDETYAGLIQQLSSSGCLVTGILLTNKASHDLISCYQKLGYRKYHLKTEEDFLNFGIKNKNEPENILDLNDKSDSRLEKNLIVKRIDENHSEVDKKEIKLSRNLEIQLPKILEIKPVDIQLPKSKIDDIKPNEIQPEKNSNKKIEIEILKNKITNEKLVDTKLLNGKAADTKIPKNNIVNEKAIDTKLPKNKINEKNTKLSKSNEIKVIETKVSNGKIADEKIAETKLPKSKIVKKTSDKKVIEAKSSKNKIIKKMIEDKNLNTKKKNSSQKNLKKETQTRTKLEGNKSKTQKDQNAENKELPVERQIKNCLKKQKMDFFGTNVQNEILNLIYCGAYKKKALVPDRNY